MLLIALFLCSLCLVAGTPGLQCRTVKGNSCIFPFTYKGVTYDSCTRKDSVKAWCATEVLSNGVVVNSKWEDCGECRQPGDQFVTQDDKFVFPEDQFSPTECLTRQNKPCVFPFTYRGEVHNKCTQANSENGAFWCATKVDRTGKVVRNAWGDCQANCASECASWVEARDGEIPPQAFGAGVTGIQGRAKLGGEIVVRARHEGGLYPGTFLSDLGEVDIPWRERAISKSQYQVLVENSNQNCQLNFVNKKKTERNNGEEMFSKALVIGGHDGNGSLTATYICKVNDNNKLGASFGRAVGTFNREKEICYLPVGDKVFPYSGDGIELLANINGLIVNELQSGGSPPTHLSGVAGMRLFINQGVSCSSNSPCLRTNEAGQSFCCEATLRNRFPSCRRVGNCQRLQSDLADQRVEGTCSTIGGASVNKPCILPFKYQGVEYHTCTFVDSENNKAWCSTEVDSRGEHIGGQGKWGDCGRSCPIPK